MDGKRERQRDLELETTKELVDQIKGVSRK